MRESAVVARLSELRNAAMKQTAEYERPVPGRRWPTPWAVLAAPVDCTFAAALNHNDGRPTKNGVFIDAADAETTEHGAVSRLTVYTCAGKLI